MNLLFVKIMVRRRAVVTPRLGPLDEMREFLEAIGMEVLLVSSCLVRDSQLRLTRTRRRNTSLVCGQSAPLTLTKTKCSLAESLGAFCLL